MTDTTERLDIGGHAWAHPDLAPLMEPIAAITPHPRNPRNGDVAVIAESIRTNGVYRPVYVQRSTGRILAGNHTYAALMEMGATAIPVVWLDVDDEAAERVMLIDNRAADLGNYDNGVLLDILRGLAQTDAALVGTGYDDDALAHLIELVDVPFQPVDDDIRLDQIDPKPCPKCGYDVANDPDHLR